MPFVEVVETQKVHAPSPLRLDLFPLRSGLFPLRLGLVPRTRSRSHLSVAESRFRTRPLPAMVS